MISAHGSMTVSDSDDSVPGTVLATCAACVAKFGPNCSGLVCIQVEEASDPRRATMALDDLPVSSSMAMSKLSWL